MGKIVVGCWDCDYCGADRISGEVKICPNCGNRYARLFFRDDLTKAAGYRCTHCTCSFIVITWMSLHIIVRATRALNGKEDLYIVIDDAKTGYQKEFRNDVSSWITDMGDKVPDWAREYSSYSDRYNQQQ